MSIESQSHSVTFLFSLISLTEGSALVQLWSSHACHQSARDFLLLRHPEQQPLLVQSRVCHQQWFYCHTRSSHGKLKQKKNKCSMKLFFLSKSLLTSIINSLPLCSPPCPLLTFLSSQHHYYGGKSSQFNYKMPMYPEVLLEESSIYLVGWASRWLSSIWLDSFQSSKPLPLKEGTGRGVHSLPNHWSRDRHILVPSIPVLRSLNYSTTFLYLQISRLDGGRLLHQDFIINQIYLDLWSL